MEHSRGVREIKKMLVELNLPILPLTCVRCRFYVPDVITRVDKGFTPIDFINSKGRVTVDIGGLALIVEKTIVDECVAIIEDSLWHRYSKDFKKARMNLPKKIKVFPLEEVRGYFQQKINKSSLWKPQEIKHA